MSTLKAFFDWYVLNRQYVVPALWLATLVFIALSYRLNYNRTEGSRQSRMLQAFWPTLAQAISFHIGGIIAICVVIYPIAAIVHHELLWSFIKPHLPNFSDPKWRQYYEWATYVATVAGVLQFFEYLKRWLRRPLR